MGGRKSFRRPFALIVHFVALQIHRQRPFWIFFLDFFVVCLCCLLTILSDGLTINRIPFWQGASNATRRSRRWWPGGIRENVFPLFLLVRFTSRDGNMMMIIVIHRSAGAVQLYVPSIATDIFSVHGQCAFQRTVERSIAGRLSSRVPFPAQRVTFLLTWSCVPFCTKLVRRSDYYYLVTWSTTTYGERSNGKKWGGNIHGMIDGSWLWLTNPFSCMLRITSATRVRLSTTRLCCHCDWPVGWLLLIRWVSMSRPTAGFISGRTPPPAVLSFIPSVRLFGGGRKDDRHGPFFPFHCSHSLQLPANVPLCV